MPTSLHSAAVMEILSTGVWTLTRHKPDPQMTDNFNQTNAWSASRLAAPYCDEQGCRLWTGASAYEALVAAHRALTLPLPCQEPKTPSLVENQLGLFFAVGPITDTGDAYSDLQSKSFDALEVIFRERAMSDVGVDDLAGNFRYLPIELCSCEWDSYEEMGQVLYSVWFHATQPFTQDQAVKLRTMAQEAYRSVCGEVGQFVRAEIYEKWAYSQRGAFHIEG